MEIDKVLRHMPILTYGTTLLGAYCKLLKLTNTKNSDKKNNRTYAQSLNRGDNAILQAMFYIPTVRQRSIATHTHLGKHGGFYSSSYLKEHIMHTPCIMVWFWDSRFTKLLNENKLGSVPISMHFAEKNDIDDINLEYGLYNPNDTEIVLEHKDLRPNPDYILISSSIKHTNIKSKCLVKDIFFPDISYKTRFLMINDSFLKNPNDDIGFEKYIYSNRKIELQIRKAILNDLYGVNKIPKEWRGWINKIRFYIENIPKINKLNARM